jgi:hypothetical protein
VIVRIECLSGRRFTGEIVHSTPTSLRMHLRNPGEPGGAFITIIARNISRVSVLSAL